MLPFDEFKNKYFLDINIISQTPIHIGASQEGLSPLEVDNTVLKDSKGNAVIPGSSLKGVFRSNLEQILRGKEGIKVCDETDGNPCIDSKERKNYDNESEWFSYIEENICEVCNLFGSNSFSSRVFFSDAVADKSKQNLENRDGVKIRRDSEVAAGKAKYDYEIVSIGTVFKTELLMENVEDYQVGYILLLIDMINNGLIRFGGKKSAGLGKLKFDFKIKSITNDDILNGNFEPKDLNDEKIQKFKNSALERLSKVGEKNV
jgi:CRISPR-associated RAMP protein (TIGR02581 family)